ncbi:hypothetical protein PBI_QUEENHAZEL_11 [Mycobacterium phage QueenHazel]|uniref:Uncharacterized protein n=1 Tax=Mycobacterium phage Babsiella TaxID=2902842 RepID=G8I6P4_9CAUD|nr:minor tail protein [Mycobacterium phage Babsiella]AER48388.1 hypothetical protein BABSIELLA_11 [Mycobacterium phage Babsiella]QFG15019.1 hypothetical protein PBI_QUEENHAZEL_11 [Mycobacterium phage QueenHazel]
MGNPFEKFGVSDADLANHIRNSTEVDAGIDKFMKEEAIPFAKSISPVDDGGYAASWAVMVKARNGRGVFGPTAWYAHFVEFGTGEDKRKTSDVKRDKNGKRTVEVDDGEFRKVGQNTPTKAQGIAQKVASHFGGDLKGGITDVTNG